YKIKVLNFSVFKINLDYNLSKDIFFIEKKEIKNEINSSLF
ncbi:hypothetical protein HMPREF9454_00273, partial [Megamonas funiformis YIT 11815]